MRLLLVPILLFHPQDELRPGLLGEYFNIGHDARDFPHLPSERKPFLRRIDATIDFAETKQEFAECGLGDHFCVRWTGRIRIPADGAYVFHIKSDDGSSLWLDGKRVVDNGGLHAIEEKSGRIELKAGDHDLRLEFFENDDGAAMILSWEPPGRAKEVVPPTALFHPKDPRLDRK